MHHQTYASSKLASKKFCLTVRAVILQSCHFFYYKSCTWLMIASLWLN